MTPHEFREARRRLGLTQRQLATLMGMSRSAVQSYEHEPPPPHAARHITALEQVRNLERHIMRILNQ